MHQHVEFLEKVDGFQVFPATVAIGQPLAGLAPVSYTHLDVYKRQLLLFALLSGTAGLLAYGRAARDPSQWGRR